ncbi:hypothetical protein [Acidisphaera rubrifaciens]|uniref:Uncharacterized protein n=1 Tax=Acidisphaera rubrifaciens HS-AP3 TaxID=1231350 RepID=A0A0D6P950_9PROT|nr:hypothetical protein [Acidisphaera rubrifaciens]GAN78290.1 hypothetical protein Asru_0728_04 [Acidisphaera rubrifaciens HS-AP3]
MENGLRLTRRAVLRAGCVVPAVGLPVAGDVAPGAAAVIELVVTDGAVPLLLTQSDGTAVPLLARCLVRELP